MVRAHVVTMISVLNFKANQKPIRMSAASFNGCH